jgi:predicted restriction endonuclease
MKKKCLGCKNEFDKKKNKYCSVKCFSKTKIGKSTLKNFIGLKPLNCKKCQINFPKINGKDRREVCDNCLVKYINWEEITLHELKEKFPKKTQLNSRIVQNSRKIYLKSKKPLKCEACDYNKYIEICHIKSISSFSNTDKIKDINHIMNLVALCPNHHWEFDKQIKKFEELCPHIKPIYEIEQYESKSRIFKTNLNFKNNFYYDNFSKVKLINEKGYFRAMNIIRENANVTYKNSFKYKKCYCCDYDKHIEICHIKAISEFRNEDKIKNINNLNNLIALCRNHHKELDKKIKTLEELCPNEIISTKDNFEKIQLDFDKIIKELQIFKKNRKIKNGKVKNCHFDKKCSICNIKINKKAIFCKICLSKKRRKVKDRPDLKTIQQDLKILGSFLQVAKKYKVTDNCVRKWIKMENKK